jgi:GTP cyclohydrolase I
MNLNEELNEGKKQLIEDKVGEIMNILDLSLTDDNRETPRRIAKMLVDELFKNRNGNNIEELNNQMKLFNSPEYPDLVVVKDIPFHSVCSHHWLPFFGKVAVGYIPNKKIIGLSKIPRVIKYFSQKPQVQERLTNEIMEYLCKVIQPLYIIVYMYDVRHTCMTVRGIESEGVTNTYVDTYDEDKVNLTSMIRYKERFLGMVGK